MGLIQEKSENLIQQNQINELIDYLLATSLDTYHHNAAVTLSGRWHNYQHNLKNGLIEIKDNTERNQIVHQALYLAEDLDFEAMSKETDHLSDEKETTHLQEEIFNSLTPQLDNIKELLANQGTNLFEQISHLTIQTQEIDFVKDKKRQLRDLTNRVNDAIEDFNDEEITWSHLQNAVTPLIDFFEKLLASHQVKKQSAQGLEAEFEEISEAVTQPTDTDQNIRFESEKAKILLKAQAYDEKTQSKTWILQTEKNHAEQIIRQAMYRFKANYGDGDDDLDNLDI